MGRDKETAPLSRTALGERARLRLVVITPAGAQLHPLPAQGEVVIGRAESSQVAIDDPAVSRQHLKLRISGLPPRLEVEDLGSANGTYLRGERVAARMPVPLEPGDALEIGEVTLVVQGRGGRGPEGSPDDATGGASEDPMAQVRRLVERVAPSELSVLLLGETGVGKSHLAEEIHRRSRRSGGPFLAINCAALAEALLDSELFGHEKGAFTGASQAKAGLLESAGGGTVFLDEVGEMPAALQAKLLTALEKREVIRVGALRPRPIDVRFVAATNRDLEAASARGEFRQDLYFRLNGVSMVVPPLRRRRSELRALAERFAAEAVARHGIDRPVRIGEDAMQALLERRWPGNLRELRNAIERAAVLSAGGEISASDLPPEAPAAAEQEPDPAGERERILAALEQCAGNQSRAAKLLGISRGTLVTRLEAFGIRRPRKNQP